MMIPTELERLCNGRPKVGIRLLSVDKTSVQWGDRVQRVRTWKVRLTYRGRQLTTEFHMGLGLGTPPTAADVVYCLCSDSQALDITFEEWCDEFGDNVDSRRAERTYNECCQNGAKVRRLLGDDFDRFAAAEH